MRESPKPRHIDEYAVFLASPRDAQVQRDAVREYFRNFNHVEGPQFGVSFKVIDCENHGCAGVGEPQKRVIDQVAERHADRLVLFIGILKQRFGTSTSTHESGSIEEYEWALGRYEQSGYPDILWFFYEPEGGMSFDTTDPDALAQAAAEWKKVKEFRVPLENGTAALQVARFSSDDAFPNVLRHHISRWLREPERPWIQKTTGNRDDVTLKPSVDVSDALRRHLDRLVGATERIPLLGLGSNLQVDLPIEKAFVPLRTAVVSRLEGSESGQWRFDKSSLGEDLRDEDVDVDALFHRAAEFGGRRGVILLGDPGSGKTTVARQLAWRLAKDPSDGERLGLGGAAIPILLRLRNLDPERRAEGLRGLLDIELTDVFGQVPVETLERTERRLWILDGLDEIVDQALRAEMRRWVEEALKSNGKDRFLVTSRFQGHQGEARFGARFLECHVQPLDSPQIERFVRLWYREIEIALGGGDPTRLADAEKRASALVSLFGERDYTIGSLRELPKNPLLLTILCIVHHGGKKLPDRRAELYSQCLRVMLEDWRAAWREERGVARIHAESAMSVLAAVAWDLHQEEKRAEGPMSEMAETARPALEKLSPRSGLEANGQRFLERMRDECGVLAVVSGDQWGFLHLSFQECLVAKHAVKENRAKELASHFGESWWREVTLLALSACDNEAFYIGFYRALLETDRWLEEPNLLSRCLREGNLFLAEPFEERLLGAEWNSERKEGLMRALVSVHVTQMERLSEKLRAAGESSELLALSGENRARVSQVDAAAEEDDAEPGERPEESPDRATGQIWTDSRTGLSFVWIPAGDFRMGSKKNVNREGPVHLVRLTRGYWMSRYQVTNEIYAKYLQSNAKAKEPIFWNRREWNGSQQPVVGVSWEEAQGFCAWGGFRLPTEAEWEYACRAGEPTEYSFGSAASMLKEYAWYGSIWGGEPRPVGLKRPNNWGLYDMHGNVWEWCSDGLRAYRKGSVINPMGPVDASLRVIRGGSWEDDDEHCRSAYRYIFHRGNRAGIVGFRVVLAPPPGSVQ